MLEELSCDVLVLGSGGAGLMAALHAYDADPRLRVVLVSKGLVGKSGCTRMVHAMNAALGPDDSPERHFRETLQAGQFLNNQELAWQLASGAPDLVRELETRFGVFFDRQDDGSLRLTRFAGQAVDRSVRRGVRIGQEIMARLHDQLFARGITLVDETRGVELVHDASGQRVVGALLLDKREGEFLLARARVVVLATGGGPGMYRVTDYALEKSGDGYAMAYRAGCELMDMEFVQFMPMNLVAGASRRYPLIVEDALRYAGGQLRNRLGERYMLRYDPERAERAPIDHVVRANFLELMEGRGTPAGGVLLDVTHLGAAFLRERFEEMVHACADYGYDLTSEPLEVAPSAHFHLGGVKIDEHCRATLLGLLAAGEDAAGVHGARRIGGNTSAESLLFGSKAGAVAAELCRELELAQPDRGAVERALAEAEAPLGRETGENPFALHRALREVMYCHVGPVRDAAGLETALGCLRELEERAARVAAPGRRSWNPAWHEALDVRNLLTVARLTTEAARHRRESRGAHYRRDHPAPDDRRWLVNLHQRREGRVERLYEVPVAFTRLRPAPEAVPR